MSSSLKSREGVEVSKEDAVRLVSKSRKANYGFVSGSDRKNSFDTLVDSDSFCGLEPRRMVEALDSISIAGRSRMLHVASRLEEIDGHYFGQLTTRKNSIRGLEYGYEGGSDSTQSAVREMLAPILREFIASAADSLGKGYALTRIEWDSSGDQWWPSRVQWCDPRWVRFIDGEPRLVDEKDIEKTEALPDFIFSIHRPSLRSGSPHRDGLARTCLFYSSVKLAAMGNWAELGELYGRPFPIGKYDKNMEDEFGSVESFVLFMSDLVRSGGGAVPAGASINFQNAVSGSQSGMFADLIQTANHEMSKAILGQVGTADGGQGNSKQTEMGRVRRDILESDAYCLCDTINRDLIRPFVEFNFPDGEEVPRIVPSISRIEDLGVFAKSIRDLVEAGLPVSVEAVYDALPIRRPREGEELFGREE